MEFEVRPFLCKVNEDGRMVSIRPSEYYYRNLGDENWPLKRRFIVPKEMVYAGRDYLVTEIGNEAFFGCIGLTGIIIPDSVIKIGGSAFYGCSGLVSVIIPDSVTAIGNCAFYGCSGLMSVIIPDSVTTIGDRAFYGCSGLTSVVIPDSVTEIGQGAFSGCSDVESIVVGKDNPVYDSRENCNAIIETKTNKLIHGCKNTIILDSVTEIGDCAFIHMKDVQ